MQELEGIEYVHASSFGTLQRSLLINGTFQIVDSPKKKRGAKLLSKDVYVVGTLQWLQVDPGRQMIGSFYPHTIDDWEKDAYLSTGSKVSHPHKKQKVGTPFAPINID